MADKAHEAAAAAETDVDIAKRIRNTMARLNLDVVEKPLAPRGPIPRKQFGDVLDLAHKVTHCEHRSL
ncbi:MAG: hypothetical protein EBU90_04915 [Proteobacteria bacterium]|nr:hypothetical protein [Pseudomonadota bacterium]